MTSCASRAGKRLVDMGRLMNMQGDMEARRELFSAYEEQEQLFADHFQQTVQTHLPQSRAGRLGRPPPMLNDLHYLLRSGSTCTGRMLELHDQNAQVLSTSPSGRIEPSLSLM